METSRDDGFDEEFMEKVRLVASKAGLTVEEVLERVKRYVEEMKGLVKPDGALSLIAVELDVGQVSRDEQVHYPTIKISKLVPGMRKATVQGKIVRMYGVLSYVNRSGEPSERAEFKLADETGHIDVIVWSKSLVDRIRSGEIGEGDVIKVTNARVTERFGRVALHLDSGSDIEVLPSGYEDLPVEERRILKVKELYEREGDVVDFRGTIVRIYPVSEFTRSDGSIGRRGSLLLRDEEGDIVRVVLWGDKASLADGLIEGSIVALTDVRVVLRDDSLELHSTPRTKLDVLKEGGSGPIEGVVLFKFPLEEIGARGKKFLDLLVEIDGSLEILRVWGDWADLLSEEDPPFKLRFGPVYIDNDGLMVLSRSGTIEIVEKIASHIPPKLEKVAKKVKYRRMWIGESSDGLREFRGTVISFSDTARVTWHCPNCGARVEFEYGRFHCPNCGEIERATPLLYLTFTIDDGTGIARVVAFRDRAERILGMSTEDVIKAADELGEPSHSVPTDEVAGKMMGREVIVRGRATYLESGAVRLVLDEMEYVDPVDESRELIKEIRRVWLGGGEIEGNNG